MRKYVIFALAVVGVLMGIVVVASLRHHGPPTHPTLGLVGVFPFEGPGQDPSVELATRLKAVRLAPAKDPFEAAKQAGVRLYVIGYAGIPELHGKLYDVTAPYGPRADATARTAEDLARQLQGGILGAAVHER